MSEEHEMCSYASYDGDDTQLSSADNALPARYRTRQTPRGGKRRKTTLAKRQQSLVKLEKQLSREFSSDEETSKHPPPPPGDGEERYKIPSDDSSSSVDEDYEVDSIASSIEETLTWRGRMQVVLHSTWFHGLIVALVIADALIVIFELLLDVGAFGNLQCEGETLFEQKERCHYEDPEHCRPTAKLILEQLNISTSPGRGVGEDGLCTCKFSRGLRVCADKDGDAGVNPAVVLHVTSIIILTLFVFEIILKLIAFRLKYFTHKFEVFDGTIVFLSYLLDLASLAEEEAFEAASLVIILRLWRVVRIVNGSVLSAKSRSDQQLSEARLKARTIVHAFHKAQDKMDALEEKNRLLKKEVARAKGVRVPRGHFGLQAQAAIDKTNEQAADTQETSTVSEEMNSDERKPISRPEIVVTETGGQSGTDM